MLHLTALLFKGLNTVELELLKNTRQDSHNVLQLRKTSRLLMTCWTQTDTGISFSTVHKIVLEDLVIHLDRRDRNDLFEAFKIINGVYNVQSERFLSFIEVDNSVT